MRLPGGLVCCRWRQDGFNVQQEAHSAHLRDFVRSPQGSKLGPRTPDPKMGSVCSRRLTVRTCRSLPATPRRLQLLWRCEAWAALVTGSAAQEPAASQRKSDNITGD